MVKRKLYAILPTVVASIFAAFFVGQLGADQMVQANSTFDAVEIRAAVLEDWYLEDLTSNNPQALSKTVVLDDSILRNAPNLKQVLEGALANRDNLPEFGNGYYLTVTKGDFDSITAVLGSTNLSQYLQKMEKDNLTGQNVTIKAYVATVIYNNLYYTVSMTVVSLL